MGQRKWSRWTRWAVGLGALGSLAACAPAAAPTSPAKAPASKKAADAAPAPLAAAEEALLRTDYPRAETALRRLVECAPAAQCQSQSETARVLLARLLLETGRLDELSALPLAPERDARAALVLARAERAQGRLDRALGVLDVATSVVLPDHLALVALRAEILLEQGHRGSAAQLLEEQVIPVYSDGSLERLTIPARARALTFIGRAAHLLRFPSDANEAYNQAEELIPASAELLLYRAELFIEKYDGAHASEVLGELLARAPHRADALVAMARLLLDERLAFEPAREHVARAQAVDPHHPGARYVLASIALRDMDFPEVGRQIDAGLARSPRHLELLSLRAAAELLAENTTGFEQALDRVLALSPGYSQALGIIADHAEWEHRYEDMEQLLRRAVRLDPEDGRARGQLGLTLVRAGSDNSGVVELRRAFDDDPFNVRVKNTLELYETVIPERYVSERHGPFIIRVPQDQKELLLRYVAPLLDQAHAQMVKRYGYEPQAPLSIEIYAEREQFAVRTSGLPETPIQGVCFGRKLATVSPLGSPGNLGMTLWHELAHVFHIGLSKSRVPRWLTEGLAEWETEQLNRGWSRELDLSLYQAHQAGHLPHVGEMTRAFTHARRMEDIATAYYASGRLAGFLMETRGRDRVARLLATLGEKKLPWDALPQALELSTDQLDQEFRRALDRDLTRYREQFVSQVTRLTPTEAEQAFKREPSPASETALGQALLIAGKTQAAEEHLRRAAAKDPQAAYTLARLELAQGHPKEALQRVDRDLLGRGVDGIELRLLLAKVLVGQKRYEPAQVHLEKAVALDDSAEEVWALLASVALARKDTELELRAVGAWAARAEHDGAVHRRYLELLLARGLRAEIPGAAANAVWSDLGSAALHAAAARLWGLIGDHRAADFEWESALLCPLRPTERAQLVDEFASTLERRGLGQRARELRARPSEPPPPASESEP